MFEIAGLTIAGVAALSSLVQAYYAAKSANKEVSKKILQKAEDRASEPLKNGIKVVAEVIDEALLNTLQYEIEKRHKELIKAFRSTEVTEDERDLKVEEARLQICKFLSEVKRFNNDALPTKRLEQLWLSNKCKA